MNGHGKSDRLVVPGKSPNNAGPSVAEGMEGRSLAKGNMDQQNTSRTQSRTESVPSALDRVRELARKDRKARFTALLHHVTVDRLREAFLALRRNVAPGVDGETWEHYAEEMEDRLRNLHGRVHRGAYRAKPSRRVLIPKGDGKERVLGIASLEDKIVQRAIVEVLEAIYEEDFVGFSYGFRPGRSPHHALDALSVGIYRKKVSWVLDADIRGFFDAIDHGWLLRFVEHRIGDPRVLRLIRKWLSAGVLENAKRSATRVGTPQGATVSPLLANVYLHYVLDLWADHWRRTQARGEMIIVRFADDIVVGFQHRADAERFGHALRERLAEFGLDLHRDKTRLIEFGRFAAGEPQSTWPQEAGDLRLPGLHAHLWSDERRKVPAGTTYDAKTDAGEAEGGEGRAHAPPASSGTRSGEVVGKRRPRSCQLLRRADEYLRRLGIPSRGSQTLAPRAVAAKPEGSCPVDAHGTLSQPMDPISPSSSSLARRAVQRSYPRQEPSALAAHAGICAGGGPKPH
jgi:group II intron reverse transcriptase/maturase